MTPSQLAARLTIHEHASVGALENARLHAVDGAALPPPVRALRAVEGADKLPTPFERESLHRRLLAAADMLGASVALILALLLAGDARPALPALAGIPLVVVLFKVAGLYDRDQLRIMHSTLDELPLIVQLAGLYALSVTTLQSILL
jgi:hypothetical protein